MEEMETINPFSLAPWEKRVQTIADKEMTRQPDSNRAAYIAVSSSARNGLVELGAAIKTRKRVGDDPTVESFSSTVTSPKYVKLFMQDREIKMAYTQTQGLPLVCKESFTIYFQNYIRHNHDSLMCKFFSAELTHTGKIPTHMAAVWSGLYLCRILATCIFWAAVSSRLALFTGGD
jgi:hypothetical protein